MRKLFDTICTVEKIIAMVGIVVLTVCIFLGAVSRTMGRPLGWTTDIGMLMLTWSTFLGGDIAFREGRLANLDILLAKFPLRVQKVLAMVLYVIILLFLAALIYYGAKLTYSTRFRTFNGISNFSYSWVTVSLPISACFMMITAVLRMAGILKETDQNIVARM